MTHAPGSLALSLAIFFKQVDGDDKVLEVDVENGSTLIMRPQEWASVTSTSLDLSPKVCGPNYILRRPNFPRRFSSSPFPPLHTCTPTAT